MSGTKHNKGKPTMSYIPRKAAEDEARAWEFGKKKYGKFNYTKGFPISVLVDAMLRHSFAIAGGEDLDPESGLPHEAHIRCCAGMISECRRLGTLEDDRLDEQNKKARNETGTNEQVAQSAPMPSKVGRLEAQAALNAIRPALQAIRYDQYGGEHTATVYEGRCAGCPGPEGGCCRP